MNQTESTSSIKISLIAAMDTNRVIGNKGCLPWHLPADLAHFRKITLNKPVIMGRKTFESIGRPLPRRENIVLSKNPDLIIPGCTIVSTFNQALGVAQTQVQAQPTSEIMVIGGATVYKQALPFATHMYITHIHANHEGDTFFPEWDPNQWVIIDKIDSVSEDGLAYSIITYEHKPISI